MRRIALTGGIATGKSYVARLLRDAGVPVVDADVIARRVVEPSSAGFDAVLRRFGDTVVTPDGSIDRARLGAIVFGDDAARRDLEAIIHPAVRREIEAFFDGLPPATPLAVADIPLLYETGREGDFDHVVVAACSPNLQIARVMARDHLSREDAERRVGAQWPIGDKVRRADSVVQTEGTHEETDAQVRALVATLRDER